MFHIQKIYLFFLISSEIYNYITTKMKVQNSLRAVVFGGTGAVGKALVPQLVNSDKWSKVLCVVRNIPEEWNVFVSQGKLEVQIQKDMDRLFKIEEWNLSGFDAIFVCFGSQVKNGDQIFVKVDKQYPLCCADIAVKNKIPHYLVVSALSSDPDSKFLYIRTKGQMERDVSTKKIPIISILRPGLIKNRPDARPMEKFMQCFSCLPCSMLSGIDCSDLGFALKWLAQTQAPDTSKSLTKTTIYQNQDLVSFAKQKPNEQYHN